ncbi:hypothetical protein KGP17_17640 [Serratia sp. JSRIV001]|nr:MULTISPECIES: hypothetical protein [Serratia]UAN44276.1 hypothetical protein KGP17_17640 [Serratia sp. JSRIV001]CAI0911942.1 Uncharacterised protein [Serratia quinivorans]CAI2096209.1 Uncharacterised protein [Serratia quinivorans]
MSVIEYWELYIFDTFLEPQGPLYKDVVQAQSQWTAYVTSPNMTEKTMKKMKLKNFTMIKHGTDEFVFLSKEQQRAKDIDDDKRKMESILASYQDKKVKETVRKKMEAQLREKYGEI